MTNSKMRMKKEEMKERMKTELYIKKVRIEDE